MADQVAPNDLTPKGLNSAERWMREAIELSRGGFPAPNPHVGCVIVKDQQVVGRGFHQYAGGPHAEAGALEEAGDLAADADVYVTLEPCNHTGRTPPCSLALIKAKVRRVFIAVKDPNPVASGGVQALESAGIEVHIGLLTKEAETVNWQFLQSQRLQRSVVTVKAAISLDGKVANSAGRSKWITGERAREEGHRLRAECGAVLVGYRTVQSDDPELTARLDGVVNQPVRIVIDPDHKLTGAERVFSPSAQTLHITGRPLHLPDLLSSLFHKGVRGVLVEGGPRTISHFLEDDLADRLELFIAPKIIGEGPSWTNGLGPIPFPQEPKWDIQQVRTLGPDIQLSAKRRGRLRGPSS